MNFDQIDRRLRRSAAMREALTGQTDWSLGGDLFVFSRRESTMKALARLGMVDNIRSPTRAYPVWWEGRLTPLGRGWRKELLRRQEALAVTADRAEETTRR